MDKRPGTADVDFEVELNRRLSWSASLLVVVCLTAGAIRPGWAAVHEGTLIGVSIAASVVLFFATPDFIRDWRHRERANT
jgi:hypothetical protein